MKQHATMVIGVSGMTCGHCERHVEQALTPVTGVQGVKADHGKARVEIRFNPAATRPDRILEAAHKALDGSGYGVGAVLDTPGWTSLLASGVLALGIAGLFLLAESQGWLSVLPRLDSATSLAMVFVAGLLTSVHCVGMCGGFALAHQSQSGKTLRGLAWHTGRIVGYSVSGILVGAIGSVLTLSPMVQAIIVGLASVFMLITGLRILGWFPRIALPAPRWLKVKVPASASSSPSVLPRFLAGIVHAVMPCGPLQTMQLYALATGSWWAGGLAMAFFALGTVPLLFGFGAVSTLLKPVWQGRIARTSGFLVLFFAVIMAGRAVGQSGADSALLSMVKPASTNVTQPTFQPVMDGNYQLVGFDLQPSRYQTITVQAGIPVRWVIRATAANLNGCNNELAAPAFGIRKQLAVGDNIIEFTPTKAGTFPYSCWMGMINSRIYVVDATTGTAGQPGIVPVDDPGPLDTNPLPTCSCCTPAPAGE